jgi:hypothetical protein
MNWIKEWFDESSSQQSQDVSFSFIFMKGYLLKEHCPCRKRYGKGVNKKKKKEIKWPVN